MRLPKTAGGSNRYLPSSSYNCYITVKNPNAGQAADGTPNAPVVVAQNIHASVALWRGKEVDKSERVGQTSYKIVIRYPKTYNIDTGCQILLRNQLHSIESIADPDGQRFELHLFTWVSDDTVVNS
jgi:head-tail adaptor